MLNGENKENFTVLHALYLRFTFGTNSMHTSSRAYRILVFLSAFFYKFMLFDFQVKDAAGIIDHAQIALASPGSAEAYTCRSYLIFNCIIWMCWLNLEKFGLVRFQSDMRVKSPISA